MKISQQHPSPPTKPHSTESRNRSADIYPISDLRASGSGASPLPFSELHCRTNYSFLSGASHADELVNRAVELGYTALAITDENTLAGVVRAYAAARETNLKLIIGAELTPHDAPPVVVWAMNRCGYANLSKLLTLGRRRAPKGHCWLKLDDIAQHQDNLLAGVIPQLDGDRSRLSHWEETDPSYSWYFAPDLQKHAHSIYREVFGRRAYLLAELYQGVDDHHRLQQIKQLAAQTQLPTVAAGDVLYHCSMRMPLHDVLTAVKHKTTVSLAGRLLLPNAQRHLQTIEKRIQQFSQLPYAIERTQEITDRCEFQMDQLRYEYPEELAPDGMTPFEHLTQLTWKGASEHYPQGIPATVRDQLKHELKLIDELRYEAYFLTVWDIVRFARSKSILCQGRGSAANSAVCYVLGVTSVDPATTSLMFERFVSKERDEAPDIDVDFEHERREEVLQYLYKKYGRHRAGLAATVITYRSRSAIRDVGKALGLSLDRVDALAKQLDGHHETEDLEKRCQAVGVHPESGTGYHLCHLVNELRGFPRHLSQHVGGMVITQGNLDELVPIENASMADRTVIQWDKEDLEELGLLKVDCLCLGMLTAIRKCFAMINQHWGPWLTLQNVPQEDPMVYDMICAADTVGVFQIESRAQMTMLPRLKPRCWYDLVIEVAIVRPGPIQGDMVHPYLRRRDGLEKESYPTKEIEQVLKRTLGVPIFQEQAMKLAVVAAGFTPGEADQLRRAMGAWRKTGVIEKFKDKLMKGMMEKGLTGKFAENVFRQLRGFGEYGFPESHAASFAKLVYVSSWLKHYYPAAFTASLLNSLPMGFYGPAQLVSDAQQHNVEVLPVDVNFSDWDCTLENTTADGRPRSPIPKSPEPPSRQVPDSPALRLGLRQISGLPQEAAELMVEERKRGGPFSSVAEFGRRTGLSQSTIAKLSHADAFASLKQCRRSALWQALGQEKTSIDQPLLSGLDDQDDDAALLLSDLSPQEEVFEDYRSVGLSLKNHPISFYREELDQLNVTRSGDLDNCRNNQHVRVAGLVILRQRPATAKNITFATLEDETGVANLVIRPDIWARYYKVARTCTGWIAYGKLEKRSGVIHVVVSRIDDLSQQTQELGIKSRDFH